MPSQYTNKETLRLKALHESKLLDSPSSNALHTLLALAKRLFDVKIVAISLVDENRQWFKAQIGLDVQETSREISFCTHTINQEKPLIVNDATKNTLFADNPLVTGSPFIRFYSGISLSSSVGYKLGSFCLIDDTPRHFSAEDIALQRKLSNLIETELNRLSSLPFVESPSAGEINQSVLKVMHLFLETDDHSLAFEVMLDELITLTESGFGFIGEVRQSDSHQYLKMRAISDIAWNQETRERFESSKEDGLEFHDLDNLLGEPLRTLEPVISDDFANDKRVGGLPHGHPSIYKYCGIPIISADKVIGIIGLANRQQGYSEGFVNTITSFTLTIAMLIQRDRVFKERALHNQKLFEAAHLDEITQLPNRRSLGAYVDKLIENDEHTNTFALCFLDIDGFKKVNDSFGHEFGDKVLQSVASRLQKAIPKGDFVARISGDEFVIIFHQPHQENFDLVIASLEVPFFCEMHPVELSASAGIAMFPKDGTDIDTLLRHADHAMYQAKREGKNRFAMFDVNLHIKYQQQAQAAKAVIDALDKHEIVPYLQPKFSLHDKTILGFEVLSRWAHPERGLLAPGLFLPEIQETQAQILHDDYMFARALDLLPQVHKINKHFTLNINISSEYFNSALFVDRVQSVADIEPNITQFFVLEIVESTALGELNTAIERLNLCKSLGYTISLDDFGTSYSSLTYFRALPVDEIKIDKSFIDDILTDPYDLSIVIAIITMATAFSRDVVAEGVETQEQFDLLKQIGCQSAQGYLFAKPMPLDEIQEFCRTQL
jgi:diguanylate cyclase (GGDEF)-like protein